MCKVTKLQSIKIKHLWSHPTWNVNIGHTIEPFLFLSILIPYFPHWM